MHNSWKIVDTGRATAEVNMAFDAALLENLSDDPILHFYEWEGDSATYGHFINPAHFLNQEGLSARKVQIARRPTGGGITFHISDMAFSVLVPFTHPGYSINTLENYAFINDRIIQALLSFLGQEKHLFLLPNEKPSLDESSGHFCMAKPTKYDITFDGKKVCGGAQRRTKFGFLHQGTISLTLPPEDFLKDILKPGTCVFESMQKNSYPLIGNCPPKQLKEIRQELRVHLIQAFSNHP